MGVDRPDDAELRRRAMVDRLLERGHVSEGPVADALRSVPRHAFVPGDRHNEAYADRPLPIGDGQTISAPHMVGIMTELLDVQRGDRILEIGTGCGYHAAVTAEVVGDGAVYSVEYGEELAERARETLSELGYDVRVRTGDGAEGWPEHAPYDAAYLTCAAPELPDPVAEQVRPGGRIVAPIGTRRQTLYRYTRREGDAGDEGGTSLDRENHGGVRFVRMR